MEGRNTKTEELLQKCEEAIASIRDSEQWAAWLRHCAMFYDYSINNLILIAMQRPGATKVAGYRKWQAMGRQVKKGERAIRILAPCTRRYKVEVDGPNGKVEESRMRVVGFKPASVFDVSQTEGDELPEIARLVDEPVERFGTLLASVLSASPCPVRFESVAGSANGFYSPDEDSITVDEGLPDAHKLHTLAHEIAHATMHRDREQVPDRDTCEVQAESVAYVVCEHLGLDTGCYTFGYLASWSSDKTAKELRDSMEQIKAASAEIIRRIDAAMAAANDKAA